MDDQGNMSNDEIRLLRTQLHGFLSWWDFWKAAAAMLVTLTPVILTMAVGMQAYLDDRYDGRYAAISIVEDVKRNGAISLQAQKYILQRELEHTQKRLCDPLVQGGFRESESRKKGELRNDYYTLFGEYPYVPDCQEIINSESRR